METSLTRRNKGRTAGGTARSAAAGSRLAELRRHWSVLVGSALGVALGHALYPLYVMPLLGLQLERLYGWSHVGATSLLTSISIGSLAGMLCIGPIIDRFGPRWPAVVSTAAIGLLLTSAPLFPTSLSAWQVGTFMFSLLGSATGPVAYSRAICDVFIKARGAALGLTLGAIGLAGAVMPSILLSFMDKLGVQGALQVLGLAYICILAPAVAILLRDEPARKAEPGADPAPGAHAPVTPLSRLRWASLALGFVLISGAGFGAAASIPGLSRDTHLGSPVLIMASLSLTIMAARPLSGFLMDLTSAQVVAATSAALTALGMVLMIMAPNLLPLGAILIGISLGAEVDILAFLVSRFAEPAWESRVFSRIYFLIGVANAAMPLAFAQARALTGDYGTILAGAAIVTLIGGLLIGLLPRYASSVPVMGPPVFQV